MYISKDLKELLASVDHVTKIKKNRFLFHEGGIADKLFIIKSGRIQIGKFTSDGRELSISICREGDMTGELTLFQADAKYLFSAKIIEDAEVAIIKKDHLERELMHNSPLAFEFMRWMSEHLQRTQTKFRDLVLHGKKGALYSTLIRLTNSYGIKREDGILIDIVLTNQELANFCATSRESVNRMLNDLKKKGILSMDRNKIVVNELPFLKDEINCDNCPIYLCRIE
ncbi:Crp/Fnr family transcriptional regulator [Thalassobacillus pellis]|uniref:Crp/Fnr family transcriptional regulator n=1 Tax=Thalassobacillus pellis TaxID=748008 RepID=UPI00195FEC70|nr:Crp/Fnr family transcriptional regulator [Thalassobacillus pellis]